MNRFENIMFVWVCACIILASCSKTTINDVVPSSLHIIDVRVERKDANQGTETLPDRLENGLKHYALAYNQTQTGQVTGYVLNVSIDQVHYKSPVVSLFVGDANSMNVTGKLIDPDTQKIVKQFETSFVDGGSAILNGVSGAVLAASVAKETADETLIRGVAPEIMRQIYKQGTYVNPETRKRLEKVSLELGPKSTLSPIIPISTTNTDQ